MTRKPGPTVANLTIQYCPGKSSDNNGIQNSYLKEHGEHLDKKTYDLIHSDTAQTREQWFKEALTDLRTQLFKEGTPPSNIYIPKNIACSFSAGSHTNYKRMIMEFTNTINASGFTVILVKNSN